MLYGEKLKEICEKLGVDISSLPNRLFSTLLDAISENAEGGGGGGIFPTGTKNITDTSLTDVKKYANAQVVSADLLAENIKKGKTILGVNGELETGIIPSGSIEITENGTYDVTEYASADVNVSGGTEITEETFVVTGRNTNGEITSIDYYCPSEVVSDKAFARADHISYKSPWDSLSVISVKNKITKIGTLAFYRSLITSFDFNDVEEIGSGAFASSQITGVVFLPKCIKADEAVALDGSSTTFASCPNITSFEAPVLRRITRDMLNACNNLKTVYCPMLEGVGGVYSNKAYAGISGKSLERVELGSVGHPVSSITKNSISTDSTTVVITVFVNADYVDTAVANIRSGVPNGTIICKDANTGDTILTSEVG